MSNWKNWDGPLDETGAEWFVNRSFELEWLWTWASEVPKSFRSQALVGLRRTGKTAILHKIFNRLYHEQEKVTPIYVTFGDYIRQTEKKIDAYAFATEFFEGYWRSYLSFKYRQPELHETKMDLDDLRLFIKDVSDELAVYWLERFDRKRDSQNQWSDGRSLAQTVIVMPNAIARQHNRPTVVMIDEFQALTNVLDPDTGLYYDITNFFQRASEARKAPLIVSGSSISMMVNEALVGALSGRFQSTHLEPLAEDYATDMMTRLADIYNVQLTESLALEIWEATKGYPYSIECILRDPRFSAPNVVSENWLETFFVETLTSNTSQLREHYHEEFGKYVSHLNRFTRNILYWMIKNPEKDIFADTIADELNIQETDVRQSLDQLQKGDVIRLTPSFNYTGPDDPMLQRYIEYHHKREVEKLSPEAALDDLRKEINRVQGKANLRVGHLAEVIVGGVMDRLDSRKVDGKTYFGVEETIVLPKMKQIDRREGVIKKGEQNEIDVIGEYAILNNQGEGPKTGAWFVSVRYRNEKMGVGAVKEFIKNVTATQDEKQYEAVTRWYFSKQGFTHDAIKLLQLENIYYSDVKQFNELANLFGFLGLRF
ncbi:MAG: ATP-binding protein [Chloroflexota bacterium]